MSNFFDLSESKKKSLSVPELHNYAQRLEIDLYKLSEKSGKNIRKTKQELIDEIDSIYLKNRVQKVIEKNSNKKSVKFSDNKKPKIVISLTKNDYINDKELKKNNLNIEYLENKYNLKFNFGYIIFNGDFFFFNKDKSFVLLKKIKDNFVIIPRVITKNLINAVQYFDKLDKSCNMKIGCIELDKKDIFISDKIELDKSDKLNGINFNYCYFFDKEIYNFQIELNYLSQKNNINEEYETFKFIPKKNITYLQLIDFHNKLSNYQFKFSFKIYGPPGDIFKTNTNNTLWEISDNLLIKNYETNIGNKKTNDDSFYYCDGYITMYAKYENMKIIQNKFKEEFNSENNIIYMIRDKEYFKFDSDQFDDCIKELGTDIIEN